MGRAIVRILAAQGCDVGEHADVEAAADRVERELGPIEVWVNDAMASVFARFWDTAPEDFERATRTTFFGFVNGTRAALAPCLA